jgi:hypothetical protein
MRRWEPLLFAEFKAFDSVSLSGLSWSALRKARAAAS